MSVVFTENVKDLVLAIDDEEDDLKIFENDLKDNYIVRKAASGIEALDCLKEKSNGIKLILLDKMMECMDGFDVLKKIKADKKTSTIPVLMVTADNTVTLDDAVIAGACNLLKKPFEASELISAIESCIDDYSLVDNTHIVKCICPDIKARFYHLLRQWKEEVDGTSLIYERAMLPSYQEIIGLGVAALPLILKELEKETDHWFWALRAITGCNPVPKESQGRLKEMKTFWIQWGKQEGHI